MSKNSKTLKIKNKNFNLQSCIIKDPGYFVKAIKYLFDKSLINQHYAAILETSLSERCPRTASITFALLPRALEIATSIVLLAMI